MACHLLLIIQPRQHHLSCATDSSTRSYFPFQTHPPARPYSTVRGFHFELCCASALETDGCSSSACNKLLHMISASTVFALFSVQYLVFGTVSSQTSDAGKPGVSRPTSCSKLCCLRTLSPAWRARPIRSPKPFLHVHRRVILSYLIGD